MDAPSLSSFVDVELHYSELVLDAQLLLLFGRPVWGTNSVCCSHLPLVVGDQLEAAVVPAEHGDVEGSCAGDERGGVSGDGERSDADDAVRVQDDGGQSVDEELVVGERMSSALHK